MSIPLSQTDLQKRGARYVFAPAKQEPVRLKEAPALPAPDPALAESIAKIAAALAVAHQDTREAILNAIAVNESLVSAVQQLGKKESEGPWVAKVTKRDTLGRIAEVEFTPR